MSVTGSKILNWASADGSFKRQVSSFRDFISKNSEKFKPAAGRYHLYISYACPWVSVHGGGGEKSGV